MPLSATLALNHLKGGPLELADLNSKEGVKGKRGGLEIFTKPITNFLI